jgi:hypothetical protein
MPLPPGAAGSPASELLVVPASRRTPRPSQKRRAAPRARQGGPGGAMRTCVGGGGPCQAAAPGHPDPSPNRTDRPAGRSRPGPLRPRGGAPRRRTPATRHPVRGPGSFALLTRPRRSGHPSAHPTSAGRLTRFPAHQRGDSFDEHTPSLGEDIIPPAVEPGSPPAGVWRSASPRAGDRNRCHKCKTECRPE